MSVPRVIALIAAYNEEDVIAQVILDLIRQGVQVYLIDHASTDQTVEEARVHLGRGLIHIERFEQGQGFTWRALLQRKEALSQQLDGDWFIHQDADELRESPWKDLGLRDAFARVEAAGYNAVDFKPFDFVPTHNDFQRGHDLRESFPYWRPAAKFDRLRINAWRKQPVVDLASSGGHEVAFPSRRVFPIRFLLRHYPIRGQGHGERKVFSERLPRYMPEERAEGWHIQYDALQPDGSFVGAPQALASFDGDAERSALWLESRDAEIAQAELEKARRELEALGEDLSWFRAEWPCREKELAGVAFLRAERDALACSMKLAQDGAARHSAEMDELKSQLVAAHARIHELLTSMSWRTTAPLRLMLRRVRGY